jgi:hypothetical protein
VLHPPPRIASKLSNLPRIVSEFLQYDARFHDNYYFSLSSRANQIVTNLRGKIPNGIIDELRKLPELLLGTAVNNHQHPNVEASQ